MNTIVTKLPAAARILLGTVFFVFGLNGFLHFLPQPPMTGDAATFMGGLAATGYMFPLLKGTEVLAGTLLLSGRFVPLALAVLAPVLINITAFHAFLAPGGVGMAVVLVGLEVFLAWTYRDAFAPMLRTRVTPAGPEPRESSRQAVAAA
jgi:putative oxidoreductase